MWVRCGLGSAEMLLGGGAPGLVTPGELGWRPQTLARSPGANWSPPALLRHVASLGKKPVSCIY